MDGRGRRVPVRGDVSKLGQIIGLTDTQKAILQNYHFMSSRIAGTRQIRNSIRHIVFSSRIFYGTPVFATVTPSERHSGLAIRLFRGRRNDPAYACAAKEFLPFTDHDTPSLCPADVSAETVTFGLPVDADLPDYDLRRLITARDPLCCVNAFVVACKVELPSLYGFRMCPNCPHCATSKEPCMDIFGSNATPMGGGGGRCDAAVGAVEAQKASGVLHLHLFLYFQMAPQFSTLQELADQLRARILASEVWKEYVSYVRCASYPDAEKAESDRSAVEETWPAYAKDKSLSRLTFDLWARTGGVTSPHFFEQDFNVDAWRADGATWQSKYNARLQHALLHMNHHVHPLVNAGTGERRVLASCRPKGKGNERKADFPLTTSMTDAPLLVCGCIANLRGLPQRGPRSMLGCVLPKRNSPWLNAGPRTWIAFFADNGDIKFPQRLPVLPETHEQTMLFDVRRGSNCDMGDNVDMIYDLQAGLAMAAGCFGGYTAKMQDVGPEGACQSARVTDQEGQCGAQVS